ncbi:MAG: hypothetical protein IT378_25645 [Sandaracinaceae bacterium]|nr:hypothetical protein [Sandaracinaceae bacterium]
MNRLVLVAALSAISLVAIPSAHAQSPIGVCCGANCCFIDAMCRTRGALNPANACQACDPSTSQSAWSAVPGCVPAMDAGPPAVDGGGIAPPIDAGSTDGGSGPVPPPDGGSGGSDDAGAPRMDAGGTPPPMTSGGCATAPAPSGSFGLGALALVMLAAVRRRR